MNSEGGNGGSRRPPRRWREGSSNLVRFAAGKDAKTKGWVKKKQAIKHRVIEKAQLKRKYDKFLRKEGLHKKRDLEAEASADASEESASPHPRQRSRNTAKPDPYKKAKAVAEEKDRLRAAKEEARQAASAQKEERLKERDRRRLLLKKRTTKGQPLMSCRINLMLEKIKKETEKI